MAEIARGIFIERSIWAWHLYKGDGPGRRLLAITPDSGPDRTKSFFKAFRLAEVMAGWRPEGAK